jgi:hypothetical protein
MICCITCISTWQTVVKQCDNSLQIPSLSALKQTSFATTSQWAEERCTTQDCLSHSNAASEHYECKPSKQCSAAAQAGDCVHAGLEGCDWPNANQQISPHIYEVCILGEAIQGRHQQLESLQSTGWCQLTPCTDRRSNLCDNDIHNDNNVNNSSNNTNDDGNDSTDNLTVTRWQGSERNHHVVEVQCISVEHCTMSWIEVGSKIEDPSVRTEDPHGAFVAKTFLLDALYNRVTPYWVQ